MAGRIREESIAEVREKAPIDEVVSQYVTLKNAGGGSMKGLCPFHDEKTPSFNVNPARGFYHCFGCGEGGDVIDFVMKIDGLTFVETVERLAEKYGVELKREEGDGREERPKGPARGEADRGAPGRAGVLRRAAADPRRARRPGSSSPSAASTQAAAETFGLGFAPREGEALFKHLRARGFSAGRGRRRRSRGLSQRGGSPYDRFRGAAAVADPRGERRDDRVRGAADLRRRPDRGEVPQHLRDADLQEEPGALRHRPGPARDGPLVAGGGGRGLHRRDGLPPGRRQDRGRVLRHGVRRRARQGAAPLHGRPRGVPRRGDLHLRRRRGRAGGGDQGVLGATRTSSRRPTSPSSRTGSTRATCGSRRATRRCASWSRAGCRSTGSCSATSSRKYDLDRADGRVDALRETRAAGASSIRDQSKVDAFARRSPR